MENLDQLTIEERASKAIEFLTSVQNPKIPIANPELLKGVLLDAPKSGSPLNFITIVCPNWVVKDGIRNIDPITEQTLRAQVFFGQELPSLLSALKGFGFRVNLAIVISDIISSDWIKPSKELDSALRQNVAAIKTILWRAAPLFGIGPNELPSTKATVCLQKPLVGAIPEAAKLFKENLDSTFRPRTTAGQLFLKIWTELDQDNVYTERRSDNTGLEKIRKRAAFLTALYATDGLILPQMMQKTFKLQQSPEIIGMNLEMDVPFANALIWGWSTFNRFPIITPTRNGTDWSGTIFGN